MRMLDWLAAPRVTRLVDDGGSVACPVRFRDLDAAGCQVCPRLAAMEYDRDGAITRLECHVDLLTLRATHPEPV